MRNRVFGLTLFLVTIACVQQTSYQEELIKYFELNGTEKQYNAAIDQMFQLLKNQYNSQNVPENVWQELQEEKPLALDQIKLMLVPAYQSNFTQEDIQQLIAFYESDTGKQVVKDQASLTETQKEEFTSFLNSEIGLKVQDKSEALRKMVGEVSESWSSKLYRDMVEKLKAKGFTVP